MGKVKSQWGGGKGGASILEVDLSLWSPCPNVDAHTYLSPYSSAKACCNAKYASRQGLVTAKYSGD